MAGFKNKEDQRKTVEKIHAMGMTVNGWARTRGFTKDQVKNALYRDWGIGEVGPSTQELIDKMREEKLM